MKKTFIFFQIFLIISVISLSKKSHYKKKLRKILPRTPKGDKLDNHYGGTPFNNFYGPQPTLVQQKALVLNSEGTIVNTTFSDVIHKNTDNYKCIKEIPEYVICFKLSGNCDLCSASPLCGWCEFTKSCYPVKGKEPACQGICQAGWVYERASCKNNVWAGTMDNIADDAQNVITPEEAKYKYRVSTSIRHPAVVRTPVLLGTKLEQHEIERVNPVTKKIVQKSMIDLKKPIYGEIHQVFYWQLINFIRL